MLNKNKKQVKLGQALAKNRFIARLFILYIPTWLLILIALLIIASSTNDTFLGGMYIVNIFGGDVAHFGGMMETLYFASIAAIIPVLIERSIQKRRKRLGFSVWGDATKDFDRLEIEEKLKLEQEAKKNLGISDEGSVDKTDIRYWHGLLKEGIINQEEFELKKRKLL